MLGSHCFTSKIPLKLFILLVLFSCCHALNKYSKEANQPKIQDQVADTNSKDSMKDLEKPFRLAKINLIWAKAQKVIYSFKIFSYAITVNN